MKMEDQISPETPSSAVQPAQPLIKVGEKHCIKQCKPSFTPSRSPPNLFVSSSEAKMEQITAGSFRRIRESFLFPFLLSLNLIHSFLLLPPLAARALKEAIFCS